MTDKGERAARIVLDAVTQAAGDELTALRAENARLTRVNEELVEGYRACIEDVPLLMTACLHALNLRRLTAQRCND